MKTLFLNLLVCCGLLAPLSQAQAVTYGDFAPGKKFYLKVKTKLCKRGTTNVPVPTGVPNYRVGANVLFTIGSKGQLTAAGLNMPFKAASVTANSYFIPPSATRPQGDSGTINKNFLKKPIGGSLYFVRFNSSFQATQVVYTFGLP